MSPSADGSADSPPHVLPAGSKWPLIRFPCWQTVSLGGGGEFLCLGVKCSGCPLICDEFPWLIVWACEHSGSWWMAEAQTPLWVESWIQLALLTWTEVSCGQRDSWCHLASGHHVEHSLTPSSRSFSKHLFAHPAFLCWFKRILIDNLFIVIYHQLLSCKHVLTSLTCFSFFLHESHL